MLWEMKRASRRLICTALGLGLVLAVLALPAPVMACLCGDAAEGEVEFVGTATNGPGNVLRVLAPGLVSHSAGTYTFSVEQVIRGDASDARVYTPWGGGACGRNFVIGATYEVHADYAESWYGSRTFEAPLFTTTCMQGSELRPASVLGFLSYRSSKLGPVMAGLFVAGAVALTWLRATRRARTTPGARA